MTTVLPPGKDKTNNYTIDFKIRVIDSLSAASSHYLSVQVNSFKFLVGCFLNLVCSFSMVINVDKNKFRGVISKSLFQKMEVYSSRTI